MLTGSLLLTRSVQNRVEPAFLDPRDPRLVEHGDRMIERLRDRATSTGPVRRRELREEMEPLFLGPGNQKVWEGIASLLEKRCVFRSEAKTAHEEFRLAVFEKAALSRNASQVSNGVMFDQGPFDRAQVLAEAAAEAGMDASLAEERLFGDLIEEQTLASFEGITAERLLSLYNIALVQGVLLQSLAIQAEADLPGAAELRALANRLRFHRLIGKFRKSPDGRLRLSVDGPMSIFGPAHRYGFQLACFFPALLDLSNLNLRAKLAWGKRKAAKILALDQGQDPNQVQLIWPESRPAPSNPVAEDLVALFRVMKDPLWALTPCTEVHPRGTAYWIPDLELCRLSDKKKVLIEIPGYWRNRDAEAYVAQSEKKGAPRSILCLKQSWRLGGQEDPADHPAIYLYRKAPLLAEILKRAETLLG